MFVLDTMSTTSYLKMQPDDNDADELLRALTSSFSLLADEVQLLSDRKTILEHKLRFAHEQVRLSISSTSFVRLLYDEQP